MDLTALCNCDIRRGRGRPGVLLRSLLFALACVAIGAPDSARALAALGTVDTPGDARAVAVSGSRAFVADYDQGLRVVDVSNPLAPALGSGVPTPGYAVDVVVSGSYAYVAIYDRGLQVVDVSDPLAPTPAGSVDTPGTAVGVAVSGTRRTWPISTTGCRSSTCRIRRLP
jgi:hypothetical protein